MGVECEKVVYTAGLTMMIMEVDFCEIALIAN